MKRILLIDKDKNTRHLLKAFFSKYYDIRSSNSPEVSEELVKKYNPDFLIIDINQPGGLEFCNQIQQHFHKILILILTSLKEEKDIVRGFENGADDYMVKPFSLIELSARLKALSRRSRQIRRELKNKKLICENLVLNLYSREVIINNIIIHLTPTEFEILHFFMKNEGILYTKKELCTRFTDGSGCRSAALISSYISNIRRKIKVGTTINYIHNLHKRHDRPSSYYFSPK